MEVKQGVGGLVAVDPVLVAELDDRVGESCSLLGVSICLWTRVSASQPQSGSSCSIDSRRRFRSGPISLGRVTSSDRSVAEDPSGLLRGGRARGSERPAKIGDRLLGG